MYIEDNKYSKAHYVFDTETEVWSSGDVLPFKVCGNECTVVGNSIYLLGGYEKMPNASSKVFVLN